MLSNANLEVLVIMEGLKARLETKKRANVHRVTKARVARKAQKEHNLSVLWDRKTHENHIYIQQLFDYCYWPGTIIHNIQIMEFSKYLIS